MDKLLYGKNDTERIVCVEVEEDTAKLFIRKTPEELEVVEVSNRYWLLCNKKIDNNWTRLQGDLYYKYGRQFTSRKDFAVTRGRLKNSDTFSIWNEKESLMVKDGYTYHKGMQSHELNILGIDIEGTGLDLNDESKVLLIACTFRKGSNIIRKLFAYDSYSNEREMLIDFCDYVRHIDPDIILAHNGFGYDFRYLNYIAQRCGTQLYLGRNGSALYMDDRESKFRIDGTRDLHYHKCKIYGREIIDTMFLAYKYDIGRKYSSYSLKNIIRQEGLEKSDRAHYDSSKIRFNYTIPSEWEQIKRYCEHDADDLISLYDLMIAPFFYLAVHIPKSFQEIMTSASGSQINAMMIRGYLQDKHSIPKADPVMAYPGAISFGIPGIWNNTFKVDVASLYPSIMLHYKVYSPEKDPKAYLYEITKTLREKRLYHKKLAKESQYHDNMQATIKILINSLYGFMGASGLNFNYLKGADFVTRTGREILTKAIQWASGEEYGINKQHEFENFDIDES